MQIELRGWLSVEVDGEELFEGDTLPVRFVSDIDEDEIAMGDGAVSMRFSIPVELDVSDEEWLRAVSEAVVRHFGSEPGAG